LLAASVRINVTDKYGKTPLQYAQDGNFQVCIALLRGEEVPEDVQDQNKDLFQEEPPSELLETLSKEFGMEGVEKEVDKLFATFDE
jgi:hypothetical protein